MTIFLFFFAKPEFFLLGRAECSIFLPKRYTLIPVVEAANRVKIIFLTDYGAGDIALLLAGFLKIKGLL